MRVVSFKPERGQTDYTHARFAPVINCVVKYRDKILLVKRSKTLTFYPGYWNGVSGFLDDRKSFEEKVSAELREEVGIKKKDIRRIRLGPIFHQEASKYKKTWIVHPVLVKTATNKVKLDWEAEEYKWVRPREAKKLKLLPGLDIVLRQLNL